jgi:hypothetical protein
MKQSKPQTDGGFKTGDRVKLIPGTLAWNAETTLQSKRGEVVECRNDGRISVRFENGRLLMGRPAAQFERLAEFDLKAKK